MIIKRLHDIFSVEPKHVPDSCRKTWKKVGEFPLRELINEGKIKFIAHNKVRKEALYGYQG